MNTVLPHSLCSIPMKSYDRPHRPAARDLFMFAHPELWPLDPFLPLRRDHEDGRDFELGLLDDASGVSGTYGYRCTVFLTNVLDLPPTESEILALPRLVYDTLEEIASDHWYVD
jgi:hypothetical protein